MVIKTLTGVAAAVMLMAVAAPTPAAALPAAPMVGVQADQSTVQDAQWRRGRRWYRSGYRYRYYRGPYAYGPYAPYAYAPYPYYAPGPFVRFGPFGFGVW